MDESDIEKIKEYIEKCPLLKDKQINVDYLKEDTLNYSIDIEPVKPIISKDILGIATKQISFDFCVQAPFSNQALINLANSKFCEDFQKWIETKDDNSEYPEIGTGTLIECTNSGHLFLKQKTTAIYVISIRYEYLK